ncbi:MAG TPA: Gfo/Idh/MocA family oxidoreductase [Tepidisphaeraceae bacterium]|nr:Gfo/Idh/MocA family oxidoreductase [Tepidisphaeraceae bacterium]
MTKRWRIAGINFDHMHMGDLLRQVHEHPSAEIVGVCDAQVARMRSAIDKFAIPADRVFTDVDECVERSKPDMVIVCAATAEHAVYVERIAPYGVHVFVEKPFATSLAEADRMIAAVAKTAKQLVINWPLRWYPSHVTTKRLADEGLIGEVIQVHYYDGNRGPMRHVADKVEIDEATANREKSKSWFYHRDKGGGSLMDYLGYGTTLGTWYMSGRAPVEVTAMVDRPAGLDVDEHSITICRYDIPGSGLSKFETRWGTFTDPWTHQPQPKCGFVLVGRQGTIASYDYEKTIRVQTREREAGYNVPVDELSAPNRNPIEYVLNCLEQGKPVDGPLSPAICRIGQQIVDAAARSATERRTVSLAP